jgi:hypothetical protein
LFEARVHRRIFGLERDEITGGWITLHAEERRNGHFSQILFELSNQVDEMHRACSTHGREVWLTYNVLEGTSEGKRNQEDLSIDERAVLKGSERNWI